MASDRTETKNHTVAQRIFLEQNAVLQTLIRDVLRDEREVMHLKRRSDIHQRIYEHVKRVIK